MRPPRKLGPAPTEARLREAALRHLSRFSATEAGLRRVLTNKVRRWATMAEAEGRDTAAVAPALAAIPAIVAAMVGAGAVDDTAFAEARARRLLRGGRSRRAAAAHLAAKGIAVETASAALDQGPDERDAALALCKRRRIGPFGPPDPPPELYMKWLGTLARAGFARDIAEAALRRDPEEAADRLIAMRQ
ncbi:hypothetical protein EOD42_04400 [Rhodovarius crocodyli]|uniref:Regulatory protein RecX n=1 Tax=Rhodovarius crocodyli TaxID=1979269 RepID=A0A437MP01_9PROT|nr:RecX family transcriptional regulator [Rhodovarius crocodyli]RVT99340.1 hypothetical protein EOD42_04400 [Rhodovarius crocodyli]